MRFIRLVVDLLPRLMESWERLCIRIATEGFHKPGFYLSSVFLVPIGLRLWRRPIHRPYVRIPSRLLAFLLMVLGVLLFLKGPWIFSLLLIPGRLFGRLWKLVGFDESRPFPQPPAVFSFQLERVDKAVLAFMAVILVVFFVNRSQLMLKDDSDHNYHMAVARQILDFKGIPQWDDWEYAPAGRPHLYPPVLHLLIAAFAGNAGKIVHGYETLQVVAYPLGLFLSWWFARWLFGPAVGFLAALVFSMDMACTLTMIAVLPSALVTAFMPLLFMCFLAKRSKATIILMTLALYTHLGVASLLILGLLIFSARHQGYYPFFKHVLTWSFAFFIPWFLRLLNCVDWINTPSTVIFSTTGRGLSSLVLAALSGFLSLQFINITFLVLGLIGLRRFSHPAAGFVRSMLAGFLPMLITYGGRFWMHTSPLWALLVASVLLRLLPPEPTRKRIVVLILCTLLPLPLLTFGVIGKGLKLLPNIGGATFSLAYVLSPATEDDDFNRLSAFIVSNTADREIVHVDPARQYLGDRIVHSTGRRVDVGGWSAEVRNVKMLEIVESYRRDDTNCLFVYEGADIPASLGCSRIETFGRFRVGVRGKTEPLAEQTHPPEPPRQEKKR
ncbi:MAG: hypothetical protein C0404_14880 [Verrucomicrobia bacterium]|nr:hypothetical protein [Verrucomicrobiota bacterium]